MIYFCNIDTCLAHFDGIQTRFRLFRPSATVSNTKMSGGRIEWIDIAKGVLIILVILGHMHINLDLKRWIDNFHMPAFFILSGFTFSMNKNRGSFKAFLLKKTKTLMVPYFCFSLLTIAVNTVVCLVCGDGLKPVAVNAFETFSLIGIRTLWFLPTLYFGEIVLRLLGKLHSLLRLTVVLLLIVLFMIASFFSDDINLDYFSNAVFLTAKRTAAAVVFLYIGNLFEFLYRRFISSLRGSWFSAVIAAFCLMLSVFICFFSIGTNSFVSADISCFPLFLLGALPGSFGVFFFSFFIEKARLTVLPCLGRNSLVIMAVHFLLLDIIDKAGLFSQFGRFCPLLFNIGEFAIVILVCLLFAFLINNYFPIILGKT